MKLVERVTICEVGPRDGLQNENGILSVEEKVGLIDRMTHAGFPVIEVGSFMNPKAVPQMADTDEVFGKIHRKDGVEYRALVANRKGVERAVSCGCGKVKLNVSASLAHNMANINKTPRESMAGFGECAALALKGGVGVSGSISMPFGSPWEREIPTSAIAEIIDAYLDVGVEEISLSDTSGMAMPLQVFKLCAEMKTRYPRVKWILHFHDTRGMGIANVIAGMEAGIDWFDASIGGLGGCPFVPDAAGNIASEDLLHMCDEMGIATGVDLDEVIAAAKAVRAMVGHDLPSAILRAGKNGDIRAKGTKETT